MHVHGCLQRLQNSRSAFRIRQTLRGKPDGAQCHCRKENPEDKARIPNAIHDERLFPRIRSRLFQKIETDQQVAAQADAFPSHEHEQHVVRQDQRQHGEHKEVHVAEEAVVPAFVRNVPDGVDVDQEADTGDDQDHDAGKRIEKESPVRHKRHCVSTGHLHRPRRQPLEHDLLSDAMLRLHGQQLNHRARRVNERQPHASHAEHADAGIRKPPAKEKHQRRGRQRKQRDEPEMIQKVARGRHASFISSFLSSRYHFSKSISSANTVSRFRKKAMMMPSPTAASAAASAMMKSANTCPATSPYKRENATRLMFTASRISSMDMSTTITATHFCRANWICCSATSKLTSMITKTKSTMIPPT